MKSEGCSALFTWEEGQCLLCTNPVEFTNQFDQKVNIDSCNVKVLQVSGNDPEIRFNIQTIQQGVGNIYGIDFVLFEIGSGNLSLEINETEIQITDKPKYLLDEFPKINCGEEKYDFLSVSLNSKLNPNLHLNSNNLSFRLRKEYNSNQQTIGVRNIKIWQNCQINCQYCFNSKQCYRCMIFSVPKMISKLEMVCEQFSGCSSQNCHSCWIGTSIEICASCFEPYYLDDQNNCIFGGTPTLVCSSGYESLITHRCEQYSDTIIINQRSYQGKLSHSDDISSYFKCPNEVILLGYETESYGQYYCGCNIPFCGECRIDGSCNSCKRGYFMIGGICRVECQKDLNYSLSIFLDKCIQSCLDGQYYDIQINACTNCMAGCKSCVLAYVGITCNQEKPYYYIDNQDYYFPKQCSLADSKICSTSPCNIFYFFDNQIQICISKCPVGQYIASGQIKCLDCPINCAICYSEECYICKSSYFFDPSNNMNCLACKLASTLDTCSLCPEYRFVSQNCIKQCMSQQYYDITSDMCMSCKLSTSEATCQQCYPNYTFDSDSSTCILPCLSTQYYNFTSDMCISCKLSTSEATCQQCYPNYTFDSDSSTCILPCLSTQYYDFVNNICKNCPSNCQSCKSTISTESSTCKTCNTGYKVNSNGQCEQLSKPISNQNSFDFKIQVNDLGYQLQLESSSPLFTYQNFTSLVDISISTNPEFTFEAFLLEEKLIKINIQAFNSIKNAKAVILIQDRIFSQNRLLATFTYLEDLPTFVFISQSTRQTSDIIVIIGNVISLILVVSILITIVLNNFFLLVNTFDVTGYLYYLLFLDIRYPKNVIDFFAIFKNFKFSFIPNMFENAVDPNYTQESPHSFTQMNTDLYFLKNVGQTITIWTIIIGIYIVGKMLIFVPLPSIQVYLKKAMATWIWSSFFDLLWATYIYALIGVLLQLYSYDCGDHSCIGNYLLHTICLIGMIMTPFLVTWLIWREKDIKNSSYFMIKLSTLVGGVMLFDLEEKISDKKLIKIEPFSERKHLSQINDKEDNQNITSFNNLQFTSNSKSQNQNVAQTTREFTFIKQNEISKQIGTTLILNSQTINNFSSQILLTSSTKDFSKLPSNVMIKFTKYYNSVLYFRKMFFAIVIVFANQKPYFQLVWNIILMFFVFSFHLYLKPLISKYEIIKNCVGELCLISIYIMAMLLINDSAQNTEESRIQIGWAMITMSGLILLWHTLWLLMKIKRIIFSLVLKSLSDSKSQKIQPQGKRKSVAGSSAEKENIQLEKIEDFESQDNHIELTQKIQEDEKDEQIKQETEIKSAQELFEEKENISQNNQSESKQKISYEKRDGKNEREAQIQSDKISIQNQENVELEKIKDLEVEPQNNQIELTQQIFSDSKDLQIELETKSKSAEESFQQKENIEIEKTNDPSAQNNLIEYQNEQRQQNLKQSYFLPSLTNPTMEKDEIINGEEDMYAEFVLGRDILLFTDEN